jgi:hypothetical protein
MNVANLIVRYLPEEYPVLNEWQDLTAENHQTIWTFFHEMNVYPKVER